MTVLRALGELDRAWVAAIEPATMLERALSQDHPAQGDEDGVPKAVSDLAEPAIELGALLEAGAARLRSVLEDASDDGEPDGACAAVAFVQERRLELGATLARVFRLETLLDLRAFSRRRDRVRRGREWSGWWSVVVRWLDDLHSALIVADAALAECWRELAERPSVHLAGASVGRLTVREQPPRPPRPPAGPRALRPVRAATRTGDT